MNILTLSEFERRRYDFEGLLFLFVHYQVIFQPVFESDLISKNIHIYCHS